jgi:histidinol-phosphate aminotransferase
MTACQPKEPSEKWLQNFLTPSLTAAKAYRIETPDCPIKLDQNECPWDFPVEMKQRVADKVAALKWNRYPPAFADQLNSAIAQYAGVPAECVMTGPGSNQLITLVLSALARNLRGKMIIARPSFPLYESHCQYDAIPYEPWLLNDDLEYDINTIPEMPAGSVLVFASPNNPVGNTMSYEDLNTLLTQNPESFIIADEAYFEFIERPYTDLLNDHANLILIRTFSKTLGAAGVRVGYMISNRGLIAELQKLRLPYLLNHFGFVAALEILENPEMRDMTQQTIQNVLHERSRVFELLNDLSASKVFKVKKPFANFFLLQFASQDKMLETYRSLIDQGVLVRNVSGAPMMTGCLRATIGLPEENDQFLAALGNALRKAEK